MDSILMTKLKNKKGVLFDFWDTLAYIKNKEIVMNFKKFVEKNLGENYWKNLFLLNIEESDFLKELKKIDNNIYKLGKKMLQEQENNYKLFDDVLPLLEYLKEHNYKIGVVSNVFFITNKIIQHSKINNLIDALIFSYKTGYKKPEKEIFNVAIKTLNLKSEEILFIGDSLNNDYFGAKNAGIDALLLDRKNKYENKYEKISNLHIKYK